MASSIRGFVPFISGRRQCLLLEQKAQIFPRIVLKHFMYRGGLTRLRQSYGMEQMVLRLQSAKGYRSSNIDLSEREFVEIK